MSQMFDPVKGFGVTFATMFKKVTTELYPEVKKPTAPRYHGRHVLNRHDDGLEKCVGCELCAWACPADAIYVEGRDNTEHERYSPGERYGAIYQINYLRCIFCGYCIEACPTRALTMSNEYELADDNRRDLIFTKEQLLEPLRPGMERPPHAMRLGDNENDYYARESNFRPVPPADPRDVYDEPTDFLFHAPQEQSQQAPTAPSQSDPPASGPVSTPTSPPPTAPPPTAPPQSGPPASGPVSTPTSPPPTAPPGGPGGAQ